MRSAIIGNRIGKHCRTWPAGAKFAPAPIRPDPHAAPGLDLHRRWPSAAAGIPATTQGARRFGTLEFAPCTLSSPGLPLTVAAQCARRRRAGGSCPARRPTHRSRARVGAEQRAQAASRPGIHAGGRAGSIRARQLRGRVARLPRRAATQARHAARPAWHRARQSARLRTGRTRRGCPERRRRVGRKARAARPQRCLERLEVDPRFFTTSDAVSDLERRARPARRGADQPGRHFLWHAGRARVPAAVPVARARPSCSTASCRPELALGAEHARNLEQSIDLQLARCATR